MNELTVFNNEEFGEIRTMTIEGEPWFVAADVCRALDLSNPTIATNRLDEDERAKFNLGRQGDGTIINESGLYSLHSEAFKGLRHKVHSISLSFGGGNNS